MTGDRDEDQSTPTTEDMIDDCEAELAAVANRTHFSADQRMNEAEPVIDKFIRELWQSKKEIGENHDLSQYRDELDSRLEERSRKAEATVSSVLERCRDHLMKRYREVFKPD